MKKIIFILFILIGLAVLVAAFNPAFSNSDFEKIEIICGDCVTNVWIEKKSTPFVEGFSYKVTGLGLDFFNLEANNNCVDTINRQCWIEDDNGNVLAYGNFSITNADTVFIIEPNYAIFSTSYINYKRKN
ncbi:MAG: hypothetical protein JW812_03235 [Alphaproteobacteria bacterium]|nr:hypothetical protein [Alphaproteobacteria bacterium]MBN2779822.1 hypothetical protein [Alphaproteobacteria bacterium]